MTIFTVHFNVITEVLTLNSRRVRMDSGKFRSSISHLPDSLTLNSILW
ncbi:MAG: hypothetical protein RID09_01230 [Coleofasciculus sp. G1-WW12-02]